MKQVAWWVVSVTVIIVVVDWTRLTSATMCAPCYHPTTGEYIGPDCPALPSNDPEVCEPVFRHCGCCLQCAGKVGEICHQMTPPCESHLMCVSETGDERHYIAMGDQFIGRCRQPLNPHLGRQHHANAASNDE